MRLGTDRFGVKLFDFITVFDDGGLEGMDLLILSLIIRSQLGDESLKIGILLRHLVIDALREDDGGIEFGVR